MGRYKNNPFRRQYQFEKKMFKIVLSVFVSLLVLEQVSGKKCYECVWSSDKIGIDTCGDFNTSTPTCQVAAKDSCLKSTAKIDGNRVSTHTCDKEIAGELTLCSNQKNKCKKHTIAGTTAKTCCCDEEFCNSGPFLYSSVLVVFSALLAHWVM